MDLSLPKLLVGKAFQPGDTHVGLNMAINENQLIDGQDIAKVTFTIETDSGHADINDQLYLLNQDGAIVELEVIEGEGFKKSLNGTPSSDSSILDKINQLKDKIGFGGDHIDQSGLRTIQVDIFNFDNILIAIK